MRPSETPDGDAGAMAEPRSPGSLGVRPFRPGQDWPGLPPGVEPRPEMELILCCARTRLDESRTERIRAMASQGLDWEALLRTARLHGMTALLYRHLNAVVPED